MNLIDKLWRYSIDTGTYGGIVIADSLAEAENKVRARYGEAIRHSLIVWQVINDDYYETEHPDVIDCY